MADFITPLLIVVSISLLFAYFRKRFPIEGAGESEFSKTAPNIWTVLTSCILLPIAVITFIVVSFLSRSINYYLADSARNSRFLLLPDPAWWYLYAGFFAASTCYLFGKPLIMLLMGTNAFQRWELAGNRKVGFNSGKALNMLGLVVIVPYSFFFLPSLMTHTSFSDSEVGIQAYAELKERRYAYHDVRRLAVVSGYKDRFGAFHEDPRILIDFADGHRWSSRDGFRDPEKLNGELLSFLAQRTGATIERAELEEQLAPLASP